MTFEEAREWLFAQPQAHDRIATINQRESQHNGKDNYVSCEMAIFHMINSEKDIHIYGHKSWAEAKAQMEAKLNAAGDQCPQKDVAA